MTALVWLFVIALGAGVGSAGWALTRARDDGGRAAEILAERLARGDISPEEYRERRAVIGRATGRSRALVAAVAVALILVGLAGGLVATTVADAPSHRSVDRMMDRMMGGGMMRGMGGMMGGETGRTAASPDPASDANIAVVAREFSFAPREIRLRRGDTVNIALENEGMMIHTFTVGSLGFELRAQSGDRIEGALRARERGTYKAVCTVPGHAEAGMRAVLEVV